MTRLPSLSERGDCRFPSPETALQEPNGLLAIGGNLSTDCLLQAYRQGIFPWYSAGEPIMWWSPDPRAVLFPARLKISRSLARTISRQDYTVTLDQAFADVVRQCAQPRSDNHGTWITAEMQAAYLRLHHAGHAHSAEAWWNGELVGGLYGVAIGQVFFGESMFHRRNDASKVALAHLVTRLQDCGYQLIDCQVTTAHLLSLGAEEIPRHQFCQLLSRCCAATPAHQPWAGASHPAIQP
ncbi:MAG: leucyl/phenylalanyl-tRNA--protein transferase [Gammaproteobacteria bacterium]|nr:leucyl/phenylalanyl-tRNA--protein transferase [Gammaproteobacteria bacterium]